MFPMKRNVNSCTLDLQTHHIQPISQTNVDSMDDGNCVGTPQRRKHSLRSVKSTRISPLKSSDNTLLSYSFLSVDTQSPYLLPSHLLDNNCRQKRIRQRENENLGTNQENGSLYRGILDSELINNDTSESMLEITGETSPGIDKRQRRRPWTVYPAINSINLYLRCFYPQVSSMKSTIESTTYFPFVFCPFWVCRENRTKQKPTVEMDQQSYMKAQYFSYNGGIVFLKQIQTGITDQTRFTKIKYYMKRLTLYRCILTLSIIGSFLLQMSLLNRNHTIKFDLLGHVSHSSLPSDANVRLLNHHNSRLTNPNFRTVHWPLIKPINWTTYFITKHESFSSNPNTSLNGDVDLGSDDPIYVNHQKLNQQRSALRRQRIRSRIATNIKSEILLQTHVHSMNPKLWHHKSVDPHFDYIDDFVETKTSSKQKRKTTTDWASLCSTSNLSNRSRVVITNILTVPTASTFALLLQKQCNVQMIVGVDPLAPNLLDLRVEAMDVYRTLYRMIPKFHLIVPNALVGLSKTPYYWNNEDHYKHFSEPPIWLASLQPSHIIHFESSAIEKYNEFSDSEEDTFEKDMEKSNERLYRLKHSSLSLEQILRYISFLSNNETYGMTKSNSVRTLFVMPPKMSIQHNFDDAMYTINNQINTALIESYFASSSRLRNSSTGIAVQVLELPNVFGPLISMYTRSEIPNSTYNDDDQQIYVDDAMKLLLYSLRFDEGLHRIAVEREIHNQNNPKFMKLQDKRNLTIFSYYQQQSYPYGFGKEIGHDLSQYKEPADAFSLLYGLYRPQFPCASSCAGFNSSFIASPFQRDCTPSPFDIIVEVSLVSTRDCRYVLYMVDFSKDFKNVSSIIPSNTTAGQLCRITFVSGKSEFVGNLFEEYKGNLRTKDSFDDFSRQYNGQITADGWKIIWIQDDDESSLTDSEMSLLMIDPSSFFARSVSSAMFTDSLEFAKAPDEALLRIFSAMNRREIPQKYSMKVYQPGTQLFRYVEKDPENARSATFLSAEMDPTPTSIDEYTQLLQKRVGEVELPGLQQLKFYEQAARYINSQTGRPESEASANIFDNFPFLWISTSVMIHDLEMEHSRVMRCKWYDEHLYWGNSNTDQKEELSETISKRWKTIDLSFAYTVAIQRSMGNIGPPTDLLQTWFPIMSDDSKDTKTVRQNERGYDIYMRIMSSQNH